MYRTRDNSCVYVSFSSFSRKGVDEGADYGAGVDEGADAMESFEALQTCDDSTGALCGIEALPSGNLHSDESVGQAQHHGIGLTLRKERIVRCAVIAAWGDNYGGFELCGTRARTCGRRVPRCRLGGQALHRSRAGP